MCHDPEVTTFSLVGQLTGLNNPQSQQEKQRIDAASQIHLLHESTSEAAGQKVCVENVQSLAPCCAVCVMCEVGKQTKDLKPVQGGFDCATNVETEAVT